MGRWSSPAPWSVAVLGAGYALASCFSRYAEEDVTKRVDASTEAAAPFDASIDEAASDAQPPPCPEACTAGCAGSVCQIACTRAKPCDGSSCPSGMGCAFQCAEGGCSHQTLKCTGTGRCSFECVGTNACAQMTVTCGSGPCRLVCDGGKACQNVNVEAVTAAAFCLDCRGDPGCDQMGCSVNGICGRSCATCTNIGTCSVCSQVPSCPWL